MTQRIPEAEQADLFAASPPAPIATYPVGIERGFDVPFTAELALKEKQIQQNVRPVIAVHKWFARRPGTLFRSILLSEFGDRPVRQAFYSSNDLSGLRIADPFMGGGTPLLEANRLGMDVQGWDVNPMAFWIVSQSIQTLDAGAYRKRAVEIAARLHERIGDLFTTACPQCQADAVAKYFIWIKCSTCEECGHRATLFPGSTIASAGRHPRNVFVCLRCEEIYESSAEEAPCPRCSFFPSRSPSVSRGAWNCSECGRRNAFPPSSPDRPEHKLVAIEAHCPSCSGTKSGRLFKRPDDSDLEKSLRPRQALAADSLRRWIPDDKIPAGDETDRLHRWGYKHYKELFNDRQLLCLSTLAELIASEPSGGLRKAFATNLSDLVRYQNLLCRYDTRALKSLDVFSVHGFPVGLVQCESNFIGIRRADREALVGSGGWLNITEKYFRAKGYCERPFETAYRGPAKVEVRTDRERIGTLGANGRPREVELRCASATEAILEPSSLDAVVTDPPYFANVQYAELMDFCYVWLRRLVSPEEPAFLQPSTRNTAELTGNVTLGRDLAHFAEGLAAVFSRFADALKPGRPFVFTYHHNRREAYDPIAVALLDASLVVTRSLPCPAEMGGSIHIQGTGSSILDTVFVSRRSGVLRSCEQVRTASELRELVRRDLLLLMKAAIRPTRGDARCLAFGHVTRIATWELRQGWKASEPVEAKLRTVAAFAANFGDWSKEIATLADDLRLPALQSWQVGEDVAPYPAEDTDDVRF